MFFFFSSAVAPESFAFLVGVVQYTETLYSTFDSCIYSISICKTYFSMGCWAISPISSASIDYIHWCRSRIYYSILRESNCKMHTVMTTKPCVYIDRAELLWT